MAATLRGNALLGKKSVASVEDMRALMVEEIASLEQRIRYLATDTLETFYPGGKRVDENTARNRIVGGLSGSMTAQGLSAMIEYHMVDSNRASSRPQVKAIATLEQTHVSAGRQVHFRNDRKGSNGMNPWIVSQGLAPHSGDRG